MAKTFNTILLVLIAVGTFAAFGAVFAEVRVHPFGTLIAHVGWFVTALQLRGYLHG